MANKKCRVYYADLWGLRSEKYGYLFKNDVGTTQWQELEPVAPYYFFVPKDFALEEVYKKFWRMEGIFRERSFGVTTSRDRFVVGFSKEEIVQRLRIFTGSLSNELVKEALKLKDTGTWKVNEARREVKDVELEDEIHPYAYRLFDTRWICYESSLIERDRRDIMQHILNRENLGLNLTRRLRDLIWRHVYVTSFVTDKTLLSSRDNCYFFPLYLYPDEPEGRLFGEGEAETERIPNFTTEFLQAVRESLGNVGAYGHTPSPEEIFHYIYAVLYSPTYRKRYEEFLKIDFPRVPLPTEYALFTELSQLGKELVDLHLLKHAALDATGIGFPETGSNTVEKIRYDEEAQRVYFNQAQCFEGIPKEVWEYRIGAYQVMRKYLRDRKRRKLSLDEINHYMKVAKAIRLTIELQGKIDGVYEKIDRGAASPGRGFAA